MDKQEAIKILKEFHDTSALFSVRTALETVFPELKESEDELEWLKQFIQEEVDSLSIDIRDNEDQFRLKMLKRSLEWLEKQGEQKSILNVPLREVILSIWDLGNEWKELTNGSISTEYGTQLDYIQKHWTESEYYLREKQGEKTNPYSGVSFEYNGHIWGMCARDNGVDILLDKQLFKHLEKQGKSALKAINEEKVDDPIEWKGSDEKYLFWALLSIQKDIAASEINGVNTKDLNECVKWLYSLKQRIGG